MDKIQPQSHSSSSKRKRAHKSTREQQTKSRKQGPSTPSKADSHVVDLLTPDAKAEDVIASRSNASSDKIINRSQEFWVVEHEDRGLRCAAVFRIDGCLYPAVARRTERKKMSECDKDAMKVSLKKFSHAPWVVEFDNPCKEHRRTEFVPLEDIDFTAKAVVIKQYELPEMTREIERQYFVAGAIVLASQKGTRDFTIGRLIDLRSNPDLRLAKLRFNFRALKKEKGMQRDRVVEGAPHKIKAMDRSTSWRFVNDEYVWPTTKGPVPQAVAPTDISTDPRCHRCGRFLFGDEYDMGFCLECFHDHSIARAAQVGGYSFKAFGGDVRGVERGYGLRNSCPKACPMLPL